MLVFQGCSNPSPQLKSALSTPREKNQTIGSSGGLDGKTLPSSPTSAILESATLCAQGQAPVQFIFAPMRGSVPCDGGKRADAPEEPRSEGARTLSNVIQAVVSACVRSREAPLVRGVGRHVGIATQFCYFGGNHVAEYSSNRLRIPERDRSRAGRHSTKEVSRTGQGTQRVTSTLNGCLL